MRPIKALFVRSDDSLHEWRFRWALDRYVSELTTQNLRKFVSSIFGFFADLDFLKNFNMHKLLKIHVQGKGADLSPFYV